MKIALIADIHANLQALEAVLEHAKKEGAIEIWNAGDFVGYGAYPDEVVKILKKESSKNIIGNYDQKVLRVSKKLDEWKRTKPEDKWKAFSWAYKHLSAESLNYLRSLPTELRFKVRGSNILIVHGSPLSVKEHLNPDTPAARLRTLAKAAKADVIICGHSHTPFVVEVDGVSFVNPGSVGRPDDGDPRASYAIMKIKARGIQVTHYRVEYDVEKAVAAIRKHKLPAKFADMLLKGRAWADLGDDTEEVKEVAKEKPDAAVPDEMPNRDKCVKAATKLGADKDIEIGHAKQVTRLALALFNDLKSLHGYGEKEALLLELAAMLHDIGIIEGPRKHHKNSFRIISAGDLSPLSDNDKLLVSLIALFHRKSGPSRKVDAYAALSEDDQKRVGMLAGILRVADGLDFSHFELVHSISAKSSAGAITINCVSGANLNPECESALRKGDVLQEITGRELTIKCKFVG